MEPTTVDALVRRLECLERENRRFKRILASAAAGLGLLAVAGAWQDGPKTLEAERLVLGAGEGKAGVTIGADAEGRPSVIFRSDRRDAADRPISLRSSLTVARDGVPFLQYIDQAGTIRFTTISR